MQEYSSTLHCVQRTQDDSELAAIATISAAMEKIPDREARQRVLSYVADRFVGAAQEKRAHTLPSNIARARDSAAAVTSRQFAVGGIAQLSDTGELKITIRDLKAKSALDAAIRLALVAIYAFEQLAGKRLSSRKSLTPLLKQWRLYDGNTRARLARERGIMRDGDNLSLDEHAKLEAQKYIDDIQNPELNGTWKPYRVRRTRGA